MKYEVIVCGRWWSLRSLVDCRLYTISLSKDVTLYTQLHIQTFHGHFGYFLAKRSPRNLWNAAADVWLTDWMPFWRQSTALKQIKAMCAPKGGSRPVVNKSRIGLDLTTKHIFYWGRLTIITVQFGLCCGHHKLTGNQFEKDSRLKQTWLESVEEDLRPLHFGIHNTWKKTTRRATNFGRTYAS